MTARICPHESHDLRVATCELQPRSWTGAAHFMTFPKCICVGFSSLFVLVACRAPATGPEASAQSGQDLFRVFCSSCHGLTGHGDGPVASVLKQPPPDLTRIAERNNGVFPAAEIFRIIDGQAALPAHGTREMPVWGYEFFGDDPDDRLAHQQATEKIEQLVKFLEELQQLE
jgi:mono/diheme cytochrome c family protein